MGRSRKPLWLSGHRGFESHPLRHDPRSPVPGGGRPHSRVGRLRPGSPSPNRAISLLSRLPIMACTPRRPSMCCGTLGAGFRPQVSPVRSPISMTEGRLRPLCSIEGRRSPFGRKMSRMVVGCPGELSPEGDVWPPRLLSSFLWIRLITPPKFHL